MNIELLDNIDYAPRVVEVKEGFPIAKADRIIRVMVDFQPVVVGSDTVFPCRFVYFPPEAQLSHRLVSETNQYNSAYQNLNANPEICGFICGRRRVKAISLRGQKSFGYLMEVDKFEQVYGISGLSADKYLNKPFDHVNGELVSEKYVVKSQNKSSTKASSKKDKKARIERLVPGQFDFHKKTTNLRSMAYMVSPDDYITVSYKIDGTSGISANVLVKKKTNIWHRIGKWLKFDIEDFNYDTLAASRRVVKNRFIEDPKNSGGNHYHTIGNEDIWNHATNRIKDRIPQGYTLYYEIAGYQGDKPIQSRQTGDYTYGHGIGEYGIYVYRITVTNPQGVKMDLSTKQIQQFCEANGFNTVPVLWEGFARDFGNLSGYEDVNQWREKFITSLEAKYNEKPCFMCANGAVEEGVVIRKEHSAGFEAYKLKSPTFIAQESSDNDKGLVNIEDNA